MAITVTAQEKAELAAAGSLLRPLAGAEGAASMPFHNPQTGQEFENLPIDPYHLSRHLRRGLIMGPASPELRAKWKAGVAERQATDDALMAKHLAESPVEPTPRFNDAVAAAVTQVLERLGVELPNAQAPQEEEEETKIEYDVQLPLFAPTDAPSESETKPVVSQASRPALHLVD